MRKIIVLQLMLSFLLLVAYILSFLGNMLTMKYELEQLSNEMAGAGYSIIYTSGMLFLLLILVNSAGSVSLLIKLKK